MRVLTENDYKVFSKILNNKEKTGISKTTGITIAELKELTGLSDTKVRVAIKSLIEYGYVELGISKGREKTHYLTKEGIMELAEITQNVINISKREM